MKEILLTIITLAVVVGVARSCVSVQERHDRRLAAKQAYIVEHKCKVTSYYGRSGEKAIYTCANGVVIREEDL